MRRLKAEVHEAEGTVGPGRGIAQNTPPPPNKGCPALNEEYGLRANSLRDQGWHKP